MLTKIYLRKPPHLVGEAIFDHDVGNDESRRPGHPINTVHYSNKHINECSRGTIGLSELLLKVDMKGEGQSNL